MTHRLVAAARPEEVSQAARLLEPIEAKLAATEALLRRKVESDVPFIARAGEYVFAGGGKRMRPALLFWCSRLLGRQGDEDVTYAAVVELIHTATLIHDDIIDHADLRRGRRTIHSLWGSNLTVLVGDWLYTTAMKMALEHDDLRVIDLFCDATLRMTEGELLALERLGDIELTRDEYFGIIDRKTAALFAAACAAPALVAPVSEDAVAALSAYGRALGTCFQLIDDLLDYTAQESALGKPVLSDLREGKLTLPLLLALPRLTTAERAQVAAVLEDRAFSRVSEGEILALVQREGTLEEVSELARAQARRAGSALEHFADCEARRALEFAAEFVLHRRA
ncbi:MAG: polyprenyl synthetase family protein [Thermoanaerobaculia bacterium]|nr:MAG: polyprenyl synthetase family protein [Thermoanaerobaculia bacterium]MBZ0102989.1 polyprenyl synthetase family protein [Thermoanaerobaculia bacterium]